MGKKPEAEYVKAIRLGFDGWKRRREGEVFVLPAKMKFSKKWMKRVPNPGLRIDKDGDELPLPEVAGVPKSVDEQAASDALASKKAVAAVSPAEPKESRPSGNVI